MKKKHRQESQTYDFDAAFVATAAVALAASTKLLVTPLLSDKIWSCIQISNASISLYRRRFCHQWPILKRSPRHTKLHRSADIYLSLSVNISQGGSQLNLSQLWIEYWILSSEFFQNESSVSENALQFHRSIIILKDITDNSNLLFKTSNASNLSIFSEAGNCD